MFRVLQSTLLRFENVWLQPGGGYGIYKKQLLTLHFIIFSPISSPMNYISVYSFTNYIDANIMLGRMKDASIECWLKNEATTTIMPIWTNAMGGIQLMVEESDVKEATEIIQQIKEEKKQSNTCPKCGSNDVEYINTMRKPVNWLSAALSFLGGDMAVMPEQRYHCFACGHEYEKVDDTEEN